MEKGQKHGFRKEEEDKFKLNIYLIDQKKRDLESENANKFQNICKEKGVFVHMFGLQRTHFAIVN